MIGAGALLVLTFHMEQRMMGNSDLLLVFHFSKILKPYFYKILLPLPLVSFLLPLPLVTKEEANFLEQIMWTVST